MPLDPNIPLQVAQPPPLQDPLTRVLTLREMMQRQQLQAAQAQEYQQRITQQQRQIDADQFLAKAYSDNLKTAPDGTVSVDYGGVKRTIATDGRYGSKIIDVDKEDQAALKASIEKQDAAIKLAATHAQRAGELLGAVDDAPTPEAKAHFLKGAQAQAKAEGLPLPPDLDVPAYTPDMDAHIHVLAQAAMDRSKQLKAHLDQSKEIRDQLTFETQQPAVKAKALNEQIAAAAPQLAQASSQTEWDSILTQYPGVKGAVGSMWSPAAAKKAAMLAVPVKEQPQYQLERQAVEDMTTAQPADWDQRINTAIKDPKLQQAAKAQIANILASPPPDLKNPGSKAKAALEVISKAQAEEATTNRELGLIGPRTQAQVNAEVQKQVQLAKLSPDAFGGIADTRSRTAAQTQYEKDSKDYADKIGAAKQLQDFVAAAQSGNKAAPGLIGIAELRQLVNRVNRQELEAVSGSAGSAYDRLQGMLGKLTEGQPIPPAVLKDIASISRTTEQAARRTYEYKVNVTNQTYGAKAKPIDLGASPQTQSGAGIAATHTLNGRGIGLDPKTNRWVYVDNGQPAQ